MPRIERQDVADIVTLGQDDQRGVGQPEIEIRISIEDPSGSRDVRSTEWFELIGAVGHLRQQRASRGSMYVRAKEVIELC